MFFNVAYQALGGLVRLIDGRQRVKIGVFTIFASIALAASEEKKVRNEDIVGRERGSCRVCTHELHNEMKASR